MTRAHVYVSSTDGYEQSADRCIDYLRACGYDFEGIIQDWAAAIRMMGDGETSVVIVADPRELDPQRKPRVEFVSDSPKPANRGKWWDERTRAIRTDRIIRPDVGE